MLHKFPSQVHEVRVTGSFAPTMEQRVSDRAERGKARALAVLHGLGQAIHIRGEVEPHLGSAAHMWHGCSHRTQQRRAPNRAGWRIGSFVSAKHSVYFLAMVQ